MSHGIKETARLEAELHDISLCTEDLRYDIFDYISKATGINYGMGHSSYKINKLLDEHPDLHDAVDIVDFMYWCYSDHENGGTDINSDAAPLLEAIVLQYFIGVKSREM